jgi:hypothetical protein
MNTEQRKLPLDRKLLEIDGQLYIAVSKKEINELIDAIELITQVVGHEQGKALYKMAESCILEWGNKYYSIANSQGYNPLTIDKELVAYDQERKAPTNEAPAEVHPDEYTPQEAEDANPQPAGEEAGHSVQEVGEVQ